MAQMLLDQDMDLAEMDFYTKVAPLLIGFEKQVSGSINYINILNVKLY